MAVNSTYLYNNSKNSSKTTQKSSPKNPTLVTKKKYQMKFITTMQMLVFMIHVVLNLVLELFRDITNLKFLNKHNNLLFNNIKNHVS